MLPLFIELDDQASKIEARDLYVCDAKVEEHETVVATLDDPQLQRLYTLGVLMKRDSEIAVLRASTGSGETRLELMRKAAELNEKGRLALNIFWLSLQDKYCLWDHEGTGIREGWKIVKLDLSEQHKEASSVIAKLLAANIVGVS